MAKLDLHGKHVHKHGKALTDSYKNVTIVVIAGAKLFADKVLLRLK